MKICKYAYDKDDDYCKTCDGIKMEIDGNVVSCDECAGYEEGNEDAPEAGNNEPEPCAANENGDMPDDTPFEPDPTPKKDVELTKPETKTKKETKKTSKPKKTEKVETVAKKEEITDDIKVVFMRYTSGATIKRGDNYFKFVAEEEIDVSNYSGNLDDAREQFWARLNGEIDKQVEELENM